MKLTFITLAAIVIPAIVIPIAVYETITGMCYAVCDAD